MHRQEETHVELEGINYYTLLEQPNDIGGAAPCVLLVHALMSNLHMWDRTVRALHEAGYSTLRFDQVGHHNTPPAHDPRRSYHMDDMTRHIHQLVKARLGQSHLRAVVGCSIGGVLALRYAMMFPKDVDSVISIAAPGITAAEHTKALCAQRIEQFEEDHRTGGDKLCHLTVNRWFPGDRPEDAEVRSEALKHVKTCRLEGYKVLADILCKYDYASEAGDIHDVRCLIVAGSEDSTEHPDTLRTLAHTIRGAKFILMRGAGHLPSMHQPEQFNELMLRFLKE